MLIPCPSCGARVDENARACPHCGRGDPGTDHRNWEALKDYSREGREQGRRDAAAGVPPRQAPYRDQAAATMWETGYRVGRSEASGSPRSERVVRTAPAAGRSGAGTALVMGAIGGGLLYAAFTQRMNGMWMAIAILAGAVFVISALLALVQAAGGR
jgi:hypothetical protein